MNASSESGECASLISCVFTVACRAGMRATPSRNTRSALPNDHASNRCRDARPLADPLRVNGQECLRLRLLNSRGWLAGEGRRPESGIVRKIVSEPPEETNIVDPPIQTAAVSF